MKQIKLLKDQPKAYGGELLKTREGRALRRPLDTKRSMHLVLRSSKAVGEMSFWEKHNKIKIQQISHRFAYKYGIKILSLANVGNHLHFHIKLTNRHTYPRFIRAITSAIAMAVSGTSRWAPTEMRRSQRNPDLKTKNRFWDYRPFTRVVMGLRAYLNLRDYVQINRLEGYGFQRQQARFFLSWHKLGFASRQRLKLLENTG